jgi:general secretion pathway protein D
LLTQNQLVQSGVISAQELVNRQVFVVPEPATNSLLLSASRDLFDVAIRLIERMDRRPPMVAIQVLVAEVSLDDRFELGAEWGLQDSLLFSRGSSTGGSLGSPVFNLGNVLTTPNTGPNVAGQGLSNFGVGRTNADGVGGLVLSASSETVGVLLRALQTAGRVQILNRPQLTTLDSQPASSNVGQRVPRVIGITQAGLGVPQQIQTEDVEVGLLLEVLPRVSPDGLILLQVGVENSSVGDPDDGIPIGFGPAGEVIRSPIINEIRSDTVVSAYSGQTVVFSGLISKSRVSIRRQIPVLGSIPWIGAAFRFDSEAEERRELLVVLTPRIIQSDEDYEMLKQIESSRMSWCLADVLNIHGDAGLSGGNGLWGPARGQMLLPESIPAAIPDRAIHNPDNYYLLPGPGQEDLYQEPNSIIEAAPMSDLSLQPGLVTEASYQQSGRAPEQRPAVSTGLQRR